MLSTVAHARVALITVAHALVIHLSSTCLPGVVCIEGVGVDILYYLYISALFLEYWSRWHGNKKEEGHLVLLPSYCVRYSLEMPGGNNLHDRSGNADVAKGTTT